MGVNGDDGMTGPQPGVDHATVVVDVANVMGSRPDGWWKDRAGAATRLLADMSRLVGMAVPGPDGAPVIIEHIVAVVEGKAKVAAAPADVTLIRAPADGDTKIVSAAHEHLGARGTVLVVTADRGLRARLPESSVVAGPGWLNELLGR